MQPDDSRVTPWLERLKAGDDAAFQPIWERFHSRILWHARRKLPRRGDVDSEGIALSAFKSFWVAARAGRFPQLNDRYGLWRLLITITNRKIADALHRRRPGHIDGEVLDALQSAEPTPEFVVMMFEELEALLKKLDDDTLRKIAIWRMEGKTSSEIAELLNCSLRTVANKLGLIRAIFRKGNKNE